MKKILLLLLFIPLLSWGQKLQTAPARLWYGGSPPATKPSSFYSLRDLWVDTISNVGKFYTGTSWVEDKITPRVWKGAKGDKGDPGATGATGATGPPGSGGGGVFPFIIVIGTGNDDAQVVAALADNRSTRRPVYLIGNITTGEISIPMDQYNLTMFCYGAVWTLRSTATALFKRVQPVNNKQALDYFTTAQFLIHGGKFRGAQNQVCFDLGASYMSAFRDIKIESFKTAIHLRFALKTTIQNVMTTNCLNGFLVDCGNWPDASYLSSNSQSNQTHIFDCRIEYQIPNASGDVGIGVYACSGVVIENTIIEGGKYKKMIDKDFKMCPNDKDFTIRNLHFEPVYGNTGAGSLESYIFIRLVGVATIDGVYSQYGGCFIDAGGQPGEVTLDISHVSWLVKDQNGKLFNNSGGTKWIFNANSYQSLLTTPSAMASYFTGVAVSYCSSTTGCGVNTYQVKGY